MIDIVGAVAVEALDPRVAPTPASPRTTATRCASSARWRPRSAWSTASQPRRDRRAGRGAGRLAAHAHHPAPRRPARRARAPSCWCSPRTGTSSSTPSSPRTAPPLARHRAGRRRGAARLPGEDAVLHPGRAARRHRRLGAALAGRARRRLAALGVDRPRRRPTPSRCRGPSSPPGPCRPGRRRLYDVRVLPDGGFARRTPLGVDLLVPRAALGDTAAQADRRGRHAGRAVGLRGDPRRSPDPASGLGDRPPHDPRRGRPARRRPCTSTRAATAGRRRSPGCTTSGRAAAPAGAAAPRRRHHRPAAGRAGRR